MSDLAPRRVVVAVLAPPVWVPPSINPSQWRLALAEDLLDVLAGIVEAEPAIAAADASALDVGWPGLRRYTVPGLDVVSLYAAVAAEGFDQAVLLAGDAPDLPGMIIAKLLRPLTTRPLAAAPAHPAPARSGPVDSALGPSGPAPSGPAPSGPAHPAPSASVRPAASGPDPLAPGPSVPELPSSLGLLGLASRLPAPSWLPAVDLDQITPQTLRRLAPRPTDVAPAPGWHRLRGPDDLARLDPGLEGWDATRSLLQSANLGELWRS